MKLLITTPLSVALDADGVTAIRAEDATGDFGILPGHQDFVTVLSPSILSYRSGGEDGPRFVALHGGVLTVRNGHFVEVATREAYVGSNLETLEQTLIHSLEQARESELQARTEGSRLQIAAIRHLQDYLQARRRGHRREEAG